MKYDLYSTATQWLAEYAVLNKEDSDFARNNTEILYIFDTQVLECYWRRDPKGVGGRFSTDSLLTTEVASYSGWLALKFLFENQLPGQRQTGYVSPAHWNEALERIQKTETRVRSDIKQSSTAEINDQLAEVLGKFNTLRSKPGLLLEEAEKQKIGRAFTDIMRAVSCGERVRRVFQNGRKSSDGKRNEPSIRDLTFCEYYNQLPGEKVRHLDFRRWHAKISRFRREQGRERNIANDAMTMASIQTMYRGNLTAGGDRPTLRFVFVTADSAIHAAHHEMLPQLQAERIPAFIRHPHVYAPLLNHANMSQSGLSQKEFETLRTVFNSVKEALEPLNPREYDRLAPITEVYDARLRRNVRLWSENVETICLANSHIVLSDAAGDYVNAERIAELLSAQDVREAAAASVSQSIGQIRDDHLQVMAVVVFDSLERTRNELRAAGQIEAEHRAPVKLIGVPIAAELGLKMEPADSHSVWLDRLLHSFRDSQAEKTPDQVIERLRVYWNDQRAAPAAQLLASCIFFAANAWETARLCAQLCQRQIPSKQKPRSPWFREAAYCEALALRMQLRSNEDVLRADELLTKNIRRHGDSLAAVRDRVELATLIFTAVIVQSIEGHLQLEQQEEPFVELISRNDPHEWFDEAMSDLTDALERLEKLEEREDALTCSRIRLQAEINMLGAQIFVRVLEFKVPGEELAAETLVNARSRLVSTIRKNAIAPSHTARVYLAVSEALIEDSEEALRAALDFLLSDEATKATKSRPDSREMAYLTNYLRRKLSTS